MARLGSNPARGKSSFYQPARVTAVVLTYIPHLEGYFSQRFDVLRLTISSLMKHTNVPFDLLVFDNGSCGPVTNYLQELNRAGAIRYLLRSKENIGNVGALKIAFQAAPGAVIAYSDDDVYFYPNWLTEQLEILDQFPNAGIVSGVAVRDAARHAMNALHGLERGDQQVLVSYGRVIPDTWETDWAISTGRDPDEHLSVTREHQDMILEINNHQAIGAANHFQFLGFKNVLLEALPDGWPAKLMWDMVQLDMAIDGNGLLRLSTIQRFCRHIGNVISADLAKEAQAAGFSIADDRELPKRRQHWLQSIPGSGRILRRIYESLFRILHDVDLD